MFAFWRVGSNFFPFFLFSFFAYLNPPLNSKHFDCT